MRIALASMQQESNTFAPVPATLQTFKNGYLLDGAAVLGLRGTATEVGGAVGLLEAAGVEVVPIVAAHAVSGGPVVAEAFNEIRDRILRGLRAAGPLDGMVMVLHGAMVVDGDDDGSGALLADVRAAVGDLPLAATLDSHANVTRRMIDIADVLVSYRTYPHIDLDGTGRRGAAALLDMLAGRLRPALGLAKVAMLHPAESHPVNSEPMRSLWARVDALKSGGTIVDGGLLPVQPWLDLPDVGFSAIVMTNGDAAGAGVIAEELAREAWAQRHAFQATLLEPDAAIRAALAMHGGPIVVSESADGPGAGSPGDSTVMLRALLDAGVTAPAMLTVVDADAARQCAVAGVGARVTVAVGGKIGAYSAPVTVTGTVRHAAATRFTFTAGYTGTVANMGLTAVLEVGSMSIVITEHSVMTTDPALYRAVGLEPTAAKIVVVKSPAQFRAAYEPIARGIINLDSPGHSPQNVRRLTWTRRPRPCFPFEDPQTPPLTVAVGARAPRP